jgi:formylglycine-generating enzyme required for sulfatase activity
MISATTKVYGAAELAILLCYPKVWRNLSLALVFGCLLVCLPLLNQNFDNPFVLYQQMFDMIASHHSDSDFVGILFARGMKPLLLPNYRMVQIVVFSLLAVAFFFRYKRWREFSFKVQALGVLTGFMILFSDCPETHTYIITFPFYAMAFWLRNKRTWIDWTLFWLLVVNFCILPTDVLCPAWLHEYIHRTYWVDVYTYFFCWLRMLWWAIGPEEGSEIKVESQKLRGALLFLLFLLPLGMQAQTTPGLRVLKVKGVTYRMRLVEGGNFMMGALPGDTLADADEVRRKVAVKSFYMGETEVTQELWDAIMPENNSKQKGAKMPVEYITYDQCKEFIAKLNQMTGLVFRLPTEAEWEYAAKGGRKSRGYLYAGSNNPKEVAYTMENDFDDHHKPVAQLKANELGLYDMSGNVWEFCDDWYRKTPTSKPSNNFHTIRGGAYDCDARYSRITNRFMYDQRRRRMEVGFRLALSVR